jgi:hypothetical protein
MGMALVEAATLYHVGHSLSFGEFLIALLLRCGISVVPERFERLR